jgi:integrase
LTRPKTESKPDNKYTPKNPLDLWDKWVESLSLPEATKANLYKRVRQMLLKANPGLTQTGWLTTWQLGASSYNTTLSFLRSCFTWAVLRGHVTVNPYANLKTRKGTSK